MLTQSIRKILSNRKVEGSYPSRGKTFSEHSAFLEGLASKKFTKTYKKKLTREVKKLALVKYALSILFCNAYRLLRIIPNNDPIMGCMLPFAKKDKWWQGALFALLTMVSFDFITMRVGLWTLVTALTYAGLGTGFHLYYKKVGEVKLKHYLGSGVLGVLVFDFVTGVLFGPALFGTSHLQAFIGQVPFTVMHLLTATGFILILTPLFDRTIVSNPALEDHKVLSRAKFWLGA